MKNKLIVNLLVVIILAFVVKGVFVLDSIHPDIIFTYKCIESLEAYLYITGVLVVAIGLSFNLGSATEKKTDLPK